MSGSNKASDFALTILVRFGGKSVNLIVFALVAHKLSLAEIGVYGYIFASTLILSTVLDLGTRNSLTVFIGKQPDLSVSYTRNSYFLFVALLALAAPATIACLKLAPGTIRHWDYFIPVFLLLSAMLHQRMLQGALLGIGNVKKFNEVELASRIVLLTLTVLCIALDIFSLFTAVWTLAASQLCASAYLALHQRRALFRGAGKVSLSLLSSLMVRGVPFMAAVVLMQLSKRLAFYVSSHNLGVSNAGIFFGLQRLTEVITEVGLAVSVVLLSHNARAKSSETAARDTAASMRVSIFVFSLMAVTMSVLSPFLVPIILGQKFSGHEILFVVLLLGTLFGSVWTILFPSLSVAASPQIVLKILAIGMLINAAFTFPLAHYFGLTGAAWSTVIVNLIISWMFLRSYKVHFQLGYKEFLFAHPTDIGLDRIKRKFLKKKGDN